MMMEMRKKIINPNVGLNNFILEFVLQSKKVKVG